jgi:MFS transporter, DHA2 family, multidrug resistance protein
MTDTADGLPVPQRYWAILTIALGLIMAVMDGAIANVALPTIAQDLHARPTFSIWIVNGYQLAITISLLSLASLGEIIGCVGFAMFGAGLSTLRLSPAGARGAEVVRVREGQRVRGE